MLRRLKNLSRSLCLGAEASIRSELLLKRILQDQLLTGLRDHPHFTDPLRLLASGYKVYSQGYEDGMIAEIFRRIGVVSHRFIEFGVEDGRECNTALLLLQGWSGAWIDGSPEFVARARAAFKDYPVEVVHAFLTAENIDEVLVRLAAKTELDLLCIDLDFNDYWIWKAVRSIQPRLVMIEYNATLPPTLRKTVPYRATGTWDRSNYFGASLGAMEALGREKGYSLVGCSATGVNAFFVRDDLVGDRFCAPFTAVNHYEPPRYDLIGPCGHRAGNGSWTEV